VSHEKLSWFLSLTRTSFQATGPQIFQLGDIVEVQVSFVAIPLRGNKWKISTILRSISLFEGKFTQVKTEFPLGYEG
jgi:hypothetical protein